MDNINRVQHCLKEARETQIDNPSTHKTCYYGVLPPSLQEIGVVAIWDKRVSSHIIRSEAQKITLEQKIKTYSLITRGHDVYLIKGSVDEYKLRLFDERLLELRTQIFQQQLEQQKVIDIQNQLTEAKQITLQFNNDSTHLKDMKYLEWEEDRIIHIGTCSEGYDLIFNPTKMPEQAFRNVDFNIDNLDNETELFNKSVNVDLEEAHKRMPRSGFLTDMCSSFTTELARALVVPTYGEKIKDKHVLSSLRATRHKKSHEKLKSRIEHEQNWQVSDLDISQAIEPHVSAIIKHPDFRSLRNLDTYNDHLRLLVSQELINEILCLDYELYCHEVGWELQLDKQLEQHQQNIGKYHVGVAIAQNNNLASAFVKQKQLLDKLECRKKAIIKQHPFNELNDLNNRLMSDPGSVSVKELAIAVNKVFLWKKELLVVDLQIKKAYDNLAYLQQSTIINRARIDRYYSNINFVGKAATLIASAAHTIHKHNQAFLENNKTAIQQFKEAQNNQRIDIHINEQGNVQLIMSLSKIKTQIEKNDKLQESVVQDRVAAIDATIENDGQKIEYNQSQTSCFSSTELSILKQRGIDISKLENRLGTALDHQLTKEQIDLLQESLKYYPLGSQLSHELGIFDSLIKSALNNPENVETRVYYTDQARNLLKNMKEIASGMAQQLKDEIVDVVTSAPIGMVTAVATHTAVVGVGTVIGGPVGGAVAETALTAVQVGLGAQAAKENISELTNAIQEGNSEQIGRSVILTARDMVMLGKSVNSGKKLFADSRPLKHNYHQLAITNNKLSYTPNAIKATTWKQIFDTELGKNLRPYTKHINGRDYFCVTKKIDNLNIKKNSIISRDRLHNDHIDIADSRGYVYLVLNYDGTINKIKTEKAVCENRRIDL